MAIAERGATTTWESSLPGLDESGSGAAVEEAAGLRPVSRLFAGAKDHRRRGA
ncbi:MAG: hypothetical protein ACRDND_04035 [Streptosporangiaceae bacterium]